MSNPLLMRLRLDQLVDAVSRQAEPQKADFLYLFIDELTYATDWDLWLKTFYDERRPIHLMATSSASAALAQRRPESGVGRWDEHYLSPYLLDEYLQLHQLDVAIETGLHLDQTVRTVAESPPHLGEIPEMRSRFMLTGGFPELLSSLDDSSLNDDDLLLVSQRVLKKDVVERVVYKDIPQVFGIDNPLNLEKLLYTLAGQFTGVLSPTSICTELQGISQPTFDRYLMYLERSFLVFTLQNYAKTEAGRQKRGRKLYFVDGAVRNAALHRGLAPLGDAVELSLLRENLVASNLHALGRQSGVRVYYWRRGREEVDLIYDHPTHPMAFEVASSESHRLDSIQSLRSEHPRLRDNCWLVWPGAPALQPQAARTGIGTLSLDLLLLCIASQASSAMQQRLGVEQPPPPLFDDN
jgi:predicted AAA+ superfamily ATPase